MCTDENVENPTSWYQDIDPREHIYSPGYGFSDKPPHVLERSLISSYATAIGLACLFYFLLLSIVPSTTYWLIGLFPKIGNLQEREISGQVVKLITTIFALIVPFTLFRFYVKIPSHIAFPLKPAKNEVLLPAMCIGLGVTVVIFFATNALITFFDLVDVRITAPSVPTLSTPGGVFLAIINRTIIPAFFMELVFRGVILHTLRRFGDGFALILSSFLFAILHTNLTQAPSAFIMGLVMGYFMLLTDSIWVPIAMHFANNLSAVIILFITRTLAPKPAMILQYALYMLMVIVAVAALLYLLRVFPKLFTIRTSRSPLIKSEKLYAFFSSPSIIVVLLVSMTIAVSQIGGV